MKKLALFALLLAFSSVAPVVSANELKVGEPFPRLTLPSVSTGEKTDVDSLLGNKLMLHLFASW